MLYLSDCLSALDFKGNLVSFSCLIKQGLTIHFNSSISIKIKTNDTFIFSAELMNGLYFITSLSYSVECHRKY